MSNRPDALDEQLRALTRRAFDDAVLVRRNRGRLPTRGWRLRPVAAAVALTVVVGAVGILVALHHSSVQAPELNGTYPPPTAAPPPGAPLNQLDRVEGVAVDSAGDLYIADGYHRRVVRVAYDGVASLVAGPAPAGAVPLEGSAAATGIFGVVLDVAVDSHDNVYILDAQLGVRRISPDGTVSTLARANGSPAFASVPGGEGSLAVTASGTVYVACGLCHPPGSAGISDVYAITAGGTVRVVAGGDRPVTGQAAAGLVPGAANSTLLASPLGVAVDVHGNVFIADSGNNRIREIGADGHVSTVAGSDIGIGGFSGDGGPAMQAELNHPERIAVDATGSNLLIVDSNNNRIRVISVGSASSGFIHTAAGDGVDGHAGDGGPAPAAQISASHPVGLAVDIDANIYLTDYGRNHVRKVGGSDGVITTIFGAP